MENESGFWRSTATELGTRIRKDAIDRLEEEFANGFDEAANIAVGLLTTKIDELLSTIKSGKYLSEQDQHLLSRLFELKTETEESLCGYWNNRLTE